MSKATVVERIEETRTLFQILPSKSTSSGREFARVINLLLFHSGRRSGRVITLFDDRAGDFMGLDAYEEGNKKIAVGYQHKFYPSPLSNNHRSDIEKSLLKATAALKESKILLEKWVLVTPDDFVESSTRKTGGDVTWFESLRKKHNLKCEVEHWGHTQLQALFIETPSIGLYYYPELFPNSTQHRKSLQGLRAQYDDAIKEEYGHIEFVGMSVYKEEAARTVPMENIYIPLSIISYGSDDSDVNVPRRSPMELLEPGTCHVLLGDPGSGKTTLFKFLALVGLSESLQKRYGKDKLEGKYQIENDDRLPVLVTLRRYADALKKNENISLVDYISEYIAADFTISGISTEFVEYYLESGKTILLFDGLDELPSPSFKNKIRNRIRNLAETYPGNTIVVSSRVYGYEGAIRLDEKKFKHHRIAKLRMVEIEQFVRDWYHARLEKQRERKEYLESLLGILSNEENVAIQGLASNPLLLTIIVLVHRIDAVLPDERHVLYQKCTETLLNTWHTSKFHEMDRLHRAKVDRLNLQRMQAVAYWMHHQMGGTRAGQQAVVSFAELHRYLAQYIDTEKPPNPDYASQDIATAFIEFVQDRAGLLVEIGDKKFSFVHLTFQEYLTAAHIRTLSELNGIKEAWGSEIEDHVTDARWREVMRLLIAGLGSNASQEYLVDQILEFRKDASTAQLLGGLLLDGVAAAEMKKGDILERLMLASANACDESDLKSTLTVYRACCKKSDGNWYKLKEIASDHLSKVQEESEKTRLRLSLLAVGLPLTETWDLCGVGSEYEKQILSLLCADVTSVEDTRAIEKNLNLLWSLLDSLLLSSPGGTFLATSLLSVARGMGYEHQMKRAFHLFLTALVGKTVVSAPPPYFVSFLFDISGIFQSGPLLAYTFDPEARGLRRSKKQSKSRYIVLEEALHKYEEKFGGGVGEGRDPLSTGHDRALNKLKSLQNSLKVKVSIAQDEFHSLFTQIRSALHDVHQDTSNWQKLLSVTSVNSDASKILCEALELVPSHLWKEVIKVVFLPQVPKIIKVVDPDNWRCTLEKFESGAASSADAYAGGFQLLLDTLFYISHYYEADYALISGLETTGRQLNEHLLASARIRDQFSQLADLTRGSNEPALRIAHCIRDLAYGDLSRIDDLGSMAYIEYRKIFEDCYWVPSEVKRQKKKQNLKAREI